MRGHELTSRVFALLAALVEERLGLHYGAENREIFATKVVERMLEAGFELALDYYYFLRYDDVGHSEFTALTEALVVGESYFFREVAALDAAVEHVVRPALAARGRARVLSAACSTGEEPLSVAMLLAEAELLDRIEIVAADVSGRALAAARRGKYGPHSVRSELPPAGRWMQQLEDGVRVADSVHARVAWHQVNLIDGAALAQLGEFDLVLCRNVLFYFRDSTVQRVLASLSGGMSPHGRLMVGVSESLLRFGTMFRCEERGGAFMYSKVAA